MDKIFDLLKLYQSKFSNSEFIYKIPFVYINYQDIDKLPYQGWKIHISATFNNFEQILDLVMNYCLKNNSVFKVIGKQSYFFKTLQKHYDRKKSGKFITIYCLNELDFKTKVIDLYNLLKELKGPSILTDCSYKDSCVHYRYGGFKSLYIYDDNNNKIIDKREIGNYCPSFIKDPFEEDGTDLNEDINSYVLNNRYDVFKAIYFSNFGGIYLAKDLLDNNKVVLIKEYRPYFGYDNFWDSIKIGLNEKQQLIDLNGINLIPKIYDSFFEQEHLFIVKEYIRGITLKDYFYKNSLLLTNVEDKNNPKLIKDLIFIVIKFIEFYGLCINENKIVLDLKLNNFIVNLKDKRLVFIDLETVHNKESEYKSNPYFVNNNWLTLNNKSNSKNSFQKRIAILLIELIFRCNNFLYFQKSVDKTFKRFYQLAKNYKLPKILVETIDTLYFSKSIVDSKLLIKNLKSINLKQYEVFEFQQTNFKKRDVKDLIENLKYTIINNSKHWIVNKVFSLDSTTHINIKKLWNKLNWFEKYFASIYLKDDFDNYILNNLNNKNLFDLSHSNIVEKQFNKIFLNIYIYENLKKEEKLKTTIKKGLKYLINNFLVKHNSIYYLTNDNFNSPNFKNGTSGLLFLIAYYFEVFNDNYFNKWFDPFTKSISSPNSLKLSFDMGLSGIGYTLIYLWKISKKIEIKNCVDEIIKVILFSYKKNKNNKISFIDMYQTLKNDLNGSIGIYLFLVEYLNHC